MRLAVARWGEFGHVSGVRNTPFDGMSEVAAGQSPLSTHTSWMLEDVQEISPGNLSVGWEIESGGMYVPGMEV